MFSFSGLLKNALDHLSIDEFEMKPVGLFCNRRGMREEVMDEGYPVYQQEDAAYYNFFGIGAF